LKQSPLRNKFRNKTENILKAIHSFSRNERVLFFLLIWTLIISVVVVLWNVNKSFLVEVPADGGRVTEGVIGAPRFINPVLAVSNADKDLTMLIFSGLMRVSPDGTLIPDLAEKYTLSDDGLIYTFILKENIFFQDGTKITTEDVKFTVLKTQDPILKSPKRATWTDVVVEIINDKEIKFILKQPYTPFLENTTLGILPKNIWKDIDPEQFGVSQFNMEPIGSGPYMISEIKRDRSGVSLYYDLKPFKDYILGKPYIEDLKIRFYANEDSLIDAFKNGDIESINAISPSIATELKNDGYNVKYSVLSRVFGVFFNQNQAPIFADKAVRSALNEALDKEKIISIVLRGYGTKIDGPIPPGSLGYVGDNRGVQTAEKTTVAPDTSVKESGVEISTENTKDTTLTRIEIARNILKRDGWKLNEEGIFVKKNKKSTEELAFSISTSDVEELKKAGELIKKMWEEMGARVELKVFGAGDLNQNVIRPRKYDSLLFGEIIGHDSDLFAFWHSSQRNDPGLNIALYANITTDKLLQDARTNSDMNARIEALKDFQQELRNDIPAVFIYAPDFIYILPKKIRGASIGQVTIPSERFSNIYEWFIETDNVWAIFVK